MGDEAPKAKPALVGWGHLRTIKCEVTSKIEGVDLDGKFPPPGSRCTLWPWGPVIYRIEETGRHVESHQIAELESAGKLRRLVPKLNGAHKKAA